MQIASHANAGNDLGAPEVSICIPAYNRPEELRVAIASALAQTVDDLEVIVTDDSDGCQDLIAEFGDVRLRYYSNQERLGMAANWQRAISLARGRYVGLLMDDDRLLPTFLERCLPAFAADQRVGVVFSNHLFDNGASVELRPSLIAGGTYENFLPVLLQHKPVAICAALMRHAVWDEILPVPAIQTADMALHIKAAEAGWAFHYVDEPLMVYRIGHSQLSGMLQFREHEVELWRQFEFPAGSAEEAARRLLFAEALLSSAAGQMQRGDFKRAKALAREAGAVGARQSGLSRRSRFVSLISRNQPAMRFAALGFRLGHRLRPSRAVAVG
jgi:GT2 family glycosyltransferase